MEPVAADHEIAFDLLDGPILLERDEGRIGGQIMQCDACRVVDDPPAIPVARRVQILGDRGLAIGHHLFAGVFRRVDENLPRSLPDDVAAVMGVALAIHPFAQADIAQQ